MISNRKIRVLIVDDSATVRKILTDTLNSEPDIEVVGGAPDPYIAIEKIEKFQPDVLTLDVEMPRIDGLTFLKKLMQARPMPVIMISSLAQQSSRVAIQALAEGAVEVLAKPAGPYSVGDFRFALAQKVRNAVSARIRRSSLPSKPVVKGPAPDVGVRPLGGAVRLIAIGASTGGTEAIERILRQLPNQMPPIVIVQHIPAGFSKAFADRLDQFCRLHVREAVDGDAANPGTALVAPGNFHMRVSWTGGGYRVSVSDGPMVCYQRPAVDVLFGSIAERPANGIVGVLLTGMGSDGALGMKQMHDHKARTIAQDERSCAIFGMPREAIRAGAVDEILPLDRIAARLVSLVNERSQENTQANRLAVR